MDSTNVLQEDLETLPLYLEGIQRGFVFVVFICLLVCFL